MKYDKYPVRMRQKERRKKETRGKERKCFEQTKIRKAGLQKINEKNIMV